MIYANCRLVTRSGSKQTINVQIAIIQVSVADKQNSFSAYHHASIRNFAICKAIAIDIELLVLQLQVFLLYARRMLSVKPRCCLLTDFWFGSRIKNRNFTITIIGY